MEVYVALKSVPDYTQAPWAPFHSVHTTLEGAIKALYPDRKDFQSQFKKWPTNKVWEGPDGFGMVKLVEVQELEEPTYSVYRYFRDNKPKKLIREGLTLEKAQKHCNLSQSTNIKEGWFDGYTEE
jgi:hypothetical protein